MHDFSARDEQALKSWLRRGIVHLLGSDGHSPERRPPKMLDAYRRIGRWAGNVVADQFGARRTPEAFLLDRTGAIRYQGRIDDQFGIGYKRALLAIEEVTFPLARSE